MFELTKILGRYYKKQVLSFFIFIAWLFFVAIAFIFSYLLFAIITNQILKSGDGSWIFVLFMIAPSGFLCCRLVLKIIKWLKVARDEA